MDFNSSVLEEMSCLEYGDINKSSLTDINQVKIDTELPPAERFMNYLQQIKNPYCFRCGTTTIRVSFAENGSDLGTLLKNHFISLKRG